MKKSIILILLVSTAFFAYAQNTELDNTTEATRLPSDTGRSLLREISVSALEDPTEWKVSIPVDRGNIGVRKMLGAPAAKQVVRAEDQINAYQPVDQYVLGAKANFYGRSLTTISIESVRPLYIPGIVKQLSVWVAGRNKSHKLSVVIRDMNANVQIYSIGKLNFTGWQKMEISIPTLLNQKDLSNGSHGLYLLGFTIDTHFEDTVGKFYVYFDDIRAISDVIDDAIKLASADDISDGW